MATNEEVQPVPPKRASPLDYRNTDLVSRLLAATPPYLYNMPLVPNSYFFSEMLRSLVQAKNENNTRNHANFHQHHQHRRSRKRSWTQTKSDFIANHLEKSDVQIAQWTHKNGDAKKLEQLDGLSLNNNNNGAKSTKEFDLTESKSAQTSARIDNSFVHDKNLPPIMFPATANASGAVSENNATSTTNMMLPPPPPMWYPPFYHPSSAPYSNTGIDPLHFFIDLRVSGHIYDRKNDKEQTAITHHEQNPERHQAHVSADGKFETHENHVNGKDTLFKQSRNSSAFTVPVPTAKNLPMNLSKVETDKEATCKTKFDVKSMGFDKGSNKTSVNYIMSNIGNIYKQIDRDKLEEQRDEDERIKTEGNGVKEETEVDDEERKREKRVKDLRALIGLELVVDYMNQRKPVPSSSLSPDEQQQQQVQHHNQQQQQHHFAHVHNLCGQSNQQSEESLTDIESAGSPALEVVAINDDVSSSQDI